MAGLETALLGVGKAVVTRGATAWLTGRRERRERSSDLTELISVGFPDLFHRRSLERQLEGVADEIASRIAATGEHEFRDLPDNEQRATLDAVVDTLVAADLSDEALLAADMDGAKLARFLRPQADRQVASAGLGAAGRAFYDRVLAECCACLVALVTQLTQFEPRAVAETLTRLSTLAAQVAEVLSRLPRVTLDAPAGSDLDSDFERRYLTAISEGLDSLELLGLPGRHRRPRLKLTVAYLSLTLSAEGTPYRRGSRTNRLIPDRAWLSLGEHDDRGARPETVNVETALAHNTRTLIRGEAGSGKTTLLRWLAVTAARGGFTGELRGWNGLVPFVVTLRRYAGKQLPAPEHLLNDEDSARLVAGLMPPAWAHRQLLGGRALVLVDGVDELTEKQRGRVRDWLGYLVTNYPDARVVVTSRPVAATERWLERQGFAATSVARMTPTAVREFVRRWHAAAAQSDTLPCRPDQLPGYESALLRHFAANPSLRALAANPLLCALLCALNLDRDTELPTNRMGLYDTALELLLERRDTAREIPGHGGPRLDYRQRMQLLQGLAWWLAVNNHVELRADTALHEVRGRLAMLFVADADAVLRHLVERSGVVRAPVVGRIDFVHRTFQEYLAAKEAAEHDNVGLLVDRAHLDRWWETVVLAAGHGHVPFCSELLAGILDRADRERTHARQLRLLAAACLETARVVPEEVRHRVEEALDGMIPPRNKKEVLSLASGGDAVLRRLPADLRSLSEVKAAATVKTAALITSHRTLDVLARYGADPRAEVQSELVDAWEYFDPDEYARRVLADSPLIDGVTSLTTRRLLPSLHHLSHLRELNLELDLVSEPVSDLVWINGLPSLGQLEVSSGQHLNLSPLAAHSTLRELWISAQGYDGLDALAGLRFLESLCLWRGGGTWTDVDFLRNHTGLRVLGLSRLDRVRDFSPLSTLGQLNLATLLDCVLPPEIFASLTTVTALNLIEASVDAGLESLVAAMPQLESLRLMECAQASDLTPLAALNLRTLQLNGSPVLDLGPLGQATTLTRLSLNGCEQISDLEPLRGLPALGHVDLRDARPGLDLSPLTGRRLTVSLRKGQDVVGVDRLGPGVRLRWY